MTEQDYDVVVLGAGSGGYATALRAAELGLSVALIERGKVGGTCLHRGCIPTKALLHAAEVADTIRAGAEFGVRSTFEGIDTAALHRHKQGVVDRLYKGLTGLIGARSIDVVLGRGRLVDAHVVAVTPPEADAPERRVRGRHVVLATGAQVRSLPEVTVGRRVLTSDEAVELDRIPESVLVLGGGVIGVEFASLWRSLGSEVTIVEAFDRLVPNEEPSISKALQRAFRKRGITSLLGTQVAEVIEGEDSVTVTLSDGAVHETDVLLLSVGRSAVTADLGLQEAGVTLDEAGFVTVNERLQTQVPSVYAVGDLVAGLQLAHRGFAHGIFVAEEIAGLDPAPVEDTQIPRVTYSDPEIGSVGLTQEQAQQRYGEVETVEYNLAGNGKSQILGTGGFVKVVRRTDGPIVGVHMIGARMGEVIGEAQLIVGWEAHPDDLAVAIHAHPTQNEALGEAALALAGKPLHSHA